MDNPLNDIDTLVGKHEGFSCKGSHIIGLLNIDTRDRGERSFWNEAFVQLALGSYGWITWSRGGNFAVAWNSVLFLKTTTSITSTFLKEVSGVSEKPVGRGLVMKTMVWQGTRQGSIFSQTWKSDCSQVQSLDEFDVIIVACRDNFVGRRRCSVHWFVS